MGIVTKNLSVSGRWAFSEGGEVKGSSRMDDNQTANGQIIDV